MNNEVIHAERIAVLETKVDDLAHSLKEIKGLLEPMTALYRAGKAVLWIGSGLFGAIHWDQIIAYLNQLTTTKH